LEIAGIVDRSIEAELNTAGVWRENDAEIIDADDSIIGARD
jgi:hypothetical protein